MADKKKKQPFGSLRPDVDDILAWNELPQDSFEPASSEEKSSFIQDRESVSYWKDAWRRLRRNKVAMVAMVIVILIGIFAFVGPMVVPYTYDQVISGANNIHPWHYSLEDQAAINAYIEEHTGTANLSPDEAVAQAEAEAAARGETLSAVDAAKIRATAKANQGKGEENVTQADAIKALGIKAKPFGYTNAELEQIAAGESVFPHVFGCDTQGRDIMVRTMIGARSAAPSSCWSSAPSTAPSPATAAARWTPSCSASWRSSTPFPRCSSSCCWAPPSSPSLRSSRTPETASSRAW